MSKVTMPEPVLVMDRRVIGHVLWTAAGSLEAPKIENGETFITTTQAEAYADARVREALEEAAEIADRNNDFSTYDAIRALIPADPRPGQP